jgi:XFP N-terminal domain
MHTKQTPLSPELLRNMHAYWRAANYLSVGQIYLYDNPLLKESLKLEHVKPRLLGHWGTTPGQNFIYVHLNRLIKQYDLNMIYLSGPGHGGPALHRASGMPSRARAATARMLPPTRTRAPEIRRSGADCRANSSERHHRRQSPGVERWASRTSLLAW